MPLRHEHRLCTARCVDALWLSSQWGRRRPRCARPLSPTVMAAIIMTQSSSMRDATLFMGSAAITGADAAILVRLCNPLESPPELCMLLRKIPSLPTIVQLMQYYSHASCSHSALFRRFTTADNCFRLKLLQLTLLSRWRRGYAVVCVTSQSPAERAVRSGACCCSRCSRDQCGSHVVKLYSFVIVTGFFALAPRAVRLCADITCNRTSHCITEHHVRLFAVRTAMMMHLSKLAMNISHLQLVLPYETNMSPCKNVCLQDRG